MHLQGMICPSVRGQRGLGRRWDGTVADNPQGMTCGPRWGLTVKPGTSGVRSDQPVGAPSPPRLPLILHILKQLPRLHAQRLRQSSQRAKSDIGIGVTKYFSYSNISNLATYMELRNRYSPDASNL